MSTIATRDSRLRSFLLVGASLLSLGAAGCDQVQGVMSGGQPKISAAALQQAATEPSVKAFYEQRQWQAAWSEDQAKTLMSVLTGASRHGLDASRFTQLIKAAEGEAARDAELTLAALSYARVLSEGAIEPQKVHDIYTLDRPKIDVAAGLLGALQSNGVAAWFDGLAPQDAEYKALAEAYTTYKQLSDQTSATPVPAGPVLRAGGSDPRTPGIAQRLIMAGYLSLTPNAGADGVFTREMSDALKSLQADAELPATGRVDDATVAAINQAPAARARQLAVNMERRRWLARNPPATRIDVNTAAAQLVYLRDGQPAWTSRAVVGEPENQTPALGETFKQLVVNPPWNVPDGIAKEEILPKGAGYMASQDMYVENGRVVQRPGPKAALGQVKFDMQNKYAIYLHDTPAKGVFQSDQRHRSHGCVRVERAVEFARFLASEHGQAEAFDAALASGETKVVPLGAEVPVRLMYHTAYVGEGGGVVFADDPYGWDEKLGLALGLEPSRRRPTARMAALLGP